MHRGEEEEEGSLINEVNIVVFYYRLKLLYLLRGNLRCVW
jgi:hypothetical protein